MYLHVVLISERENLDRGFEHGLNTVRSVLSSEVKNSPIETGHARLIRCLLHEQTELQFAESRFIQVCF